MTTTQICLLPLLYSWLKRMSFFHCARASSCGRGAAERLEKNKCSVEAVGELQAIEVGRAFYAGAGARFSVETPKGTYPMLPKPYQVGL